MSRGCGEMATDTRPFVVGCHPLKVSVHAEEREFGLVAVHTAHPVKDGSGLGAGPDAVELFPERIGHEVFGGDAQAQRWVRCGHWESGMGCVTRRVSTARLYAVLTG